MFALTDVQFSVVALMTPEGRIVERVVYDPYGRGRHHYAADYDGNGTVELADLTGTYSHLTAWFADDMQADWNRNGTTNGDTPDIFAFQTDWFAQTGNAVAAGQISRRYAAGSGINANAPDNMIGYCGYVFNPETDDYTVRYRTLDPEIGRWLQRDPAGYQDGPNLIEYCQGTPVEVSDPFGLKSTCIKDHMYHLKAGTHWYETYHADMAWKWGIRVEYELCYDCTDGVLTVYAPRITNKPKTEFGWRFWDFVTETAASITPVSHETSYVWNIEISKVKTEQCAKPKEGVIQTIYLRSTWTRIAGLQIGIPILHRFGLEVPVDVWEESRTTYRGVGGIHTIECCEKSCESDKKSEALEQ